MSYTYLVLSSEDASPVVAFPRKHELKSWCGNQVKKGLDLDGFWLYRLYSTFYGEDNRVVYLEYQDGDLVEWGP